MPGFPLYMKQMIGYAMWYIERGHNREEIIERMRRDKRFGSRSDEEYNQAVQIALANMQIQMALDVKVGEVTRKDHEEWQSNPNQSESITLAELLSRLTKLSG